jgi:hypothetical protein
MVVVRDASGVGCSLFAMEVNREALLIPSEVCFLLLRVCQSTTSAGSGPPHVLVGHTNDWNSESVICDDTFLSAFIIGAAKPIWPTPTFRHSVFHALCCGLIILFSLTVLFRL